MNEYDRINGNAKKKVHYPRKPDRELESFLPESMRTPAYYSSHSDHNGRTNSHDHHYRKIHNNKYGSSSYQSGKYNSYNNQTYSEKRGKSFKPASYDYQSEDYSHDLKDGRYRHGSPREFLGITGSKTFMSKEPVKNKFQKPVVSIDISSETFQTSETSAPSSGIVVLSRKDTSNQDKKEDEQKITILKSNGSLPSNPPVILSRAKVEDTSANLVTVPSPIVVLSIGSSQTAAVTTPYKIAAKPPAISAPDLKVVPDKVMQHPFRLIDDDFKLCDGHSAFKPYLLEQSDFLVVGVVGRQGVGKSTVANLLCSDDDNPLSYFRTATASHITHSSHATTGLDAFVTCRRLFVLDFPAMLCTGIMDTTTGRGPAEVGGRVAALAQTVPLELQVQAKALQFLTLALRVCHVVVAVQDSVAQGMAMLRCIQAASVMEKSQPDLSACDDPRFVGTPSCLSLPLLEGSDGVVKQWPSLVVVQNKMASAAQDVSLRHLVCLESHVRRSLHGCQLPYNTGLGHAPHHSVNLFCLPKHLEVGEGAAAAASFRRSVLAVGRRQFGGHATLTEKSWYEYTIREWEKIRKSRLYLDYSRLFP